MKKNHLVREPHIPYAPPVYRCVRAKEKLKGLDGKTGKSFWEAGEWITDFRDIEGDALPRPWKNTRVKVLWDEEALYVAAELEEDQIWATVTERDRLIFVDNDFEVFLAPQHTSHRYYELEMNAHNAVWDLLMEKPYRDGVHRIMAWDVHGLETAVHISGRLNDPAADNRGWSLEMKIPWFSLRECRDEEECYPTHFAPDAGEIWRMNFSRVEWPAEVVTDGDGKKAYAKRTDPATGKPLPENNWVWAPTGVIDIHMPERWGFLVFTEDGEEYPLPAEDEVHQVLRRLYYREHAFACREGHFTENVQALMGSEGAPYGLRAYVTPSLFEGIADFRGRTWHIRQDGYLWEE